MAASINVITHIPQQKFEEEFLTSIDSFNQEIEKEPFEYVALSWKKKSNEWMLQLALPHLKKLPKDVIDIEKYEEQIESIKSSLSSEKKLKFVIFDDGIYSGNQLSEILEKLTMSLTPILQSPPEFSIVCPFATIAGPLKVVKRNPNVKITFSLHRIIPGFVQSIKEKFPEKGQEILTTLKNTVLKGYPQTESLGTYFFDHKVPDGGSLALFITEGFVMNQKGEILLDGKTFKMIPPTTPPYKKL